LLTDKKSINNNDLFYDTSMTYKNYRS